MSLDLVGVTSESFLVREAAIDSPLVVEIPHAGLAIDARSASFMSTQVRCLVWDADLYVDELFARAPEIGATVMCARLSRHVIDLNAPPEAGLEEDASASEPERRIVYRYVRGIEEPIVERPVPRAERARRLRTYHRPYHEALAALLARKRQAHGVAVLLSAHSWDDRSDASPVGLVLGTLGKTSAGTAFVERIEGVAARLGVSLRHDVPHAGGYTTAAHGRPSAGTHALQIEIARRLYLDPETLALRPEGFAAATQLADELVATLLSPE